MLRLSPFVAELRGMRPLAFCPMSNSGPFVATDDGGCQLHALLRVLSPTGRRPDGPLRAVAALRRFTKPVGPVGACRKTCLQTIINKKPNLSC